MSEQHLKQLMKALSQRGAHLETTGSIEAGAKDPGFVLWSAAAAPAGDEHAAPSIMPKVFRSVPGAVVARGLSEGVLERSGPDRIVLSAKGRTSMRRLVGAMAADQLENRADSEHRPSRRPPVDATMRTAQAAAPPPLHDGAVGHSPLAWLRLRRDKSGAPYITDVEYAAGERLNRDFILASASPSVTLNWSAGAGGGSRNSAAQDAYADLLDRNIAARQRLDSALGAVDPEIAALLVDVCCHGRRLSDAERDRAWPQRSAKISLGIGLRALAVHYGLSNARTRTELVFEDGGARIRIAAS